MTFTFVNDVFTSTAEDDDRNAFIDYFEVNGLHYEAEDFHSTGGPDPIYPGCERHAFLGASGGFVANCGNQGDYVEYDLTGLFWKADWPNYAPSGVPDFDQRQGGWQNQLGNWNHCGPVALANSLWWFDSKFELAIMHPVIQDGYPLVTSYDPTWDDHDPENVPPLVEDLAYRLDTGGQRTHITHTGTYAADFAPAITQYLADHGLAGSYTVEEMASPDFQWVVDHVHRSQDVILLLGFWQLQGNHWQRIGGHYVTVPGIDGQHQMIAFSDPAADAAEAGGPGRVLPCPHGAPHLTTRHNDAGLVSHDIYNVVQTSSPGGTWGPDGYAERLGGCEFASGFYDQNWPGPEHLPGQECAGLPISVEVEYAIAVSHP